VAEPALLGRLMLDAFVEFRRAIEHVPPPGRGGAIGRLSPASWTIGHVARNLDHLVNEYAVGLDADPWCRSFARLAPGSPVSFEDASEAFERVAERASAALEDVEPAALAEPGGAPADSWLGGHTRAHLLARAFAHTFAHAGELTVVASLLARGDLGLPGAMTHATGAPIEAPPDDSVPPLLLRLALDARETFEAVASAVPVPGQVGTFERLNPAGWIVAHAAEQDDQYWDVHAQGLEADAWLTSVAVRYGDARSAPEYPAALEALRHTNARATPFLGSLRGEDLGRVIRRSRASGREQRAQDLLVRQVPHLYALAGELAAITSLAGAAAFDAPGPLRRTLEVPA
jgi:hypothetical protein